MSKHITLENLDKFVLQNPEIKSGCIIDTNILFAASYDLDAFHERAIEFFQKLSTLQIPCFINVNIRSEFINLTRRVILTESLMDLLHDLGQQLPQEIYLKLRSIETRINSRQKDNKNFKLQEEEIKAIRKIFVKYELSSQTDLWASFCDEYLTGKISQAWESIESPFGINFISLRGDENSAHLAGTLNWHNLDSIIEKTGIGSNDAMIINLLNSSKYIGIATLDEDIIYSIATVGDQNKFVLTL
jgi:predicted nucleic acid-binding protein